MRFCSFSWFFPITLGSGITRLLVTFSSRPPPTTASPTEFQLLSVTDTWFSFITFPIHLCHCKYSNQMSSALPRANVSEIHRLILGHLHFLGYQYLLCFFCYRL